MAASATSAWTDTAEPASVCSSHWGSMLGAGDEKMAKVYNTDPYRDCFAVTVPKEVGFVHACSASLQAAGMPPWVAAPVPPAGDT